MIIFDLDDTLIDTSGSITPLKMKACLEKMVEQGLSVSNFAEAYQNLLNINAQSTKSTDAIQKFIASFSNQKISLEPIFQELTTPLPTDFSIPTTPHAKEVLEFYRKICPIALITGGHPPFQREKLKKAGIDSSIFSMIAIPEDSKKKPHYERVQQEFSVSPDKIWVCGDRIAMDLKPAHELGFKTVHMRWGRGTIGPSEKWIDHSISNLQELKELIK